MAATAQLSEVQRAFVQFCSVLKELVLNHQVAHSVVQSLHVDLPALQPEGVSSSSAAGSGVARRDCGSSGLLGGGKPTTTTSATERLKRLAPRLTPTAASADGAGGTDPSYRVASECQDNYIVLQNATLRSRELLDRLGELRDSAVAALQREGGEALPADAASRLTEGLESWGWQQEGQRGRGERREGQQGKEGECRMDSPGDRSGTAFGCDVDVDVVLFPNPDAAVVSDAAVISTAGTSVTATAEDSAPGGTPRIPTWPAAAAPPVLRAARLLSSPDLTILMGELCREVALEVELLGRVAGAVELQTTADDLYAYDTFLKLQPYTDERVVAAAFAQRDLIAPPPKAQGQQHAAGRR